MSQLLANLLRHGNDAGRSAQAACERELFYGEPGRRYWGYSKDTRPLYTKDHRERDFRLILEEKYRKAIASHPEDAPAIRTSRSPDTVSGSDRTRAAKMAGNLLMAAAAGALADRIVNREFRNPPDFPVQ